MNCPYCHNLIKYHGAGVCLDALATERIFGWVWVQPPQRDYDGPLPEQGKVLAHPAAAAAVEDGDYQWPARGVIPYDFFLSERYSSDNDDALTIINEMSSTTREYWDVRFDSNGVTAKFVYDGGRPRLSWEPGEYESWDEHFALAVTRAALLAIPNPYTSEPPAAGGWHDVIFNPGDEPSRVYLHVTGGTVVWGWDEADRHKAVGVLARRVSLIRYRKAARPER